MIPVVMTELDDGRLGLLSKGAKQPVMWSQLSIDGAKRDRQYDSTDEVNVEHMKR